MDFIGPELILVVWAVLIIFGIVLPFIALISILKNRFKDNDKLIWVLVVLFLPILGSILYFVMGRSKRLR
ncbi:PLDc N-terminal domain-containing protein [Winogradskyella ursingii]|uniref:PLDc N-terminal domain-containing protein n=1 Tax=Winogradskyella ursingii TaxID=2686079 RepID=UPI0015CEF1A6|nr:PLDc N-terminal domain-containing protein [Winogradskyella ursingii]